MSVILEALRKSEAERQRGRAPGLFVEQVPARARTRRWSRAWPWLSGALLLLVLAAWAWREWGRATEPMPAPGATAALTAATPPPAAPVTAAPAPYVSEAVGALPSPPPDTRPAPAPAQAAAPSTADSVAATPQPAANLPHAVADAPAARIADAAASPPTAEAVESLPTVSSLAAAERSQLPPLKLSMHVYADAPAQRFVILDGQRLGEGASPSPGVVLEHIRRDGLVLSVNGQRLLLARP